MRITRTERLEPDRVTYSDGFENERTGSLAEDIVRLWCRERPIRSHSYRGNTWPDRAIAGPGYLELGDDGRLRMAQTWGPRTDIGCVQAFCRGQHLFNVFIEPDGSNTGPNGGGEVELTEADREQLGAAVRGWWQAHALFAIRQRRFFEERPWLELEGLTVVQALCRLDELGWPTGFRNRNPAFEPGVVVNP